MALLETRKLNKRFGGLQVTADVDFVLEPGELHCLIGPNGAGKSTLFRLILGEYQPTSGQIFYDGSDITQLESHDRIRRGISVKFQVPGIFKALSVRQNLEIALQHHLEGLSLRGEIERQLDFLNLTADASQPAGNLSHGQKQWLEIGMATSLRPKLLLLDEPTAGMSPEETHATGEMVRALADRRHDGARGRARHELRPADRHPGHRAPLRQDLRARLDRRDHGRRPRGRDLSRAWPRSAAPCLTLRRF